MINKWSCCLGKGMYVCYSDNKLFGESGLRLEHKLLRQTRCFKRLQIGQLDCLYLVTVTWESILFIHYYQSKKPWQINISEETGIQTAAHPAVDGGGATWKAGSFSKVNKESRNEVSSVRGRSVGGGGGGDGGSWHTWDTGEVEPHVKKAHRQWFNATKFIYSTCDLGPDWKYLYFSLDPNSWTICPIS